MNFRRLWLKSSPFWETAFTTSGQLKTGSSLTEEGTPKQRKEPTCTWPPRDSGDSRS